jgi:RimJ/RimL family protein N-acetyltransferase
MQTDLLHGELVHLTAATPEADLSRMLQWSQDSEFLRLLDADPARPWSARTLREDLESLPKDNSFGFMIRTRADDQTIGFVGLWVNHWVHADAWVGIGLGDRAYWGKGYGTDAMRVLLRFAFTELHLHRVSLNVFAYNPRAIRSYEKAGFVAEGRVRQALQRDGQRWDVIYMGVMREEWEKTASQSEVIRPKSAG